MPSGAEDTGSRVTGPFLDAVEALAVLDHQGVTVLTKALRDLPQGVLAAIVAVARLTTPELDVLWKTAKLPRDSLAEFQQLFHEVGSG